MQRMSGIERLRIMVVNAIFLLIVFTSMLLVSSCASTTQVKQSTKDAATYNDRGLSYVEKGQYDHAILDFNKAIEINPSIPELYYNRGLAYAKYKGQYDKAILDFNKAIELMVELNPTHPRLADAYNNRGLAYKEKRQYDTAISDYNKAIEINPRHDAAYSNRAVSYYFKQEYDKAWNDVHKAQELGQQIHPGFLNALRKASGRDR